METQDKLITPVQVITKQYVQDLLVDLFTALEDATEDTITAVTVLEHLRDGIKEDPAFSRKVLTPRNIEQAISLKRKSETGKLTLADIEAAYPDAVKMIPFWSILKTFI